RGALELGESTLLFQFAPPVRIPPKPPFPEEYRARPSNMWSRSDLTMFLSALLVLGPYFTWASLKEVDYSIEPELDDRFVRIMNLQQPAPELDPIEDEEKEELLAEEDEKLEPKEKEKVVDKVVMTDKKYSSEAMDKARGVGVARVLGTYGGDGPGTVFDVIQSTENNLGELFAAGMTATVQADGTEISPFVPGGEGISAQGAVVGTKGFEADGP